LWAALWRNKDVYRLAFYLQSKFPLPSPSVEIKWGGPEGSPRVECDDDDDDDDDDDGDDSVESHRQD